MVKEFEQYHGIVLSRLAHNSGELKISTDINSDNSSYILNDICGIYIKFSKKRLTPWQFTFNSDHYDSIKKLAEKTDKGYVVFVCGFDGLCCLSFEEFFFIIQNIDFDAAKSVSISRFKNQQYQVNGTDNEIKRKFADSELDLSIPLLTT